MPLNPLFYWRLAVAVWTSMDERHFGLIAAGVAFYAMFAVFPGMAATLSIWGAFADPSIMADYLARVHGVVPDAAYLLLRDHLDSLMSAGPSGLGWTTLVPLAIAFYSVHAGVAALVSGLNAVHARAPRAGFGRLLGSLMLTAALLAIVLSALATVVAVPIVLNFVQLGPAEALILSLLPWFVLFIVVLAALGMFYRWGPTRAGRRLPWLTPGAVLAALLWAGSSFAFTLYLTYFGSYNRIYGSIGAVVALLMWFYISAYIVLAGAVVNAEYARLRAEDQ